jgi:Protein of unknown function (DUF4236)
MGFRFRRSLRILPGVRVNISKRGLSSVSIGRRGLTLNVGRKGTKETIGLPGTGISYTTPVQHLPSGQQARLPFHVQPPAPNEHPGELTVGWIVLMLLAMAAAGVAMFLLH